MILKFKRFSFKYLSSFLTRSHLNKLVPVFRVSTQIVLPLQSIVKWMFYVSLSVTAYQFYSIGLNLSKWPNDWTQFTILIINIIFFLSPSLPVIKNSIIKNHWFGWDSKENKRVSLQYDKCIRFTTVKTVEGLPNQSIEWFVFIRIEYKAGNKMAVLGFVSGRYILWALLWKLIIWQKYGKKGTRRKITVEEREWIDRKSSTKN